MIDSLTHDKQRYEAYHSSTDFIRRYIFPGGHLPSITQLLNSITTGSSNALVVDSVLNIGPHYARTLREWKNNFLREFEDTIKPALMEQHKGMGEADVEVFRRKWVYYFDYCEAGFRTCTLGDVVVTVCREGAVQIAEDVGL